MSSVDLPAQNAIFLHVPKTAGYSISAALADGIEGARPLPVRDMHTPLGAAQYVTSRTHPGILARRWSFCFVRNPWDWTVSGYLHVTRNKRAYGDAPPGFADFVRNRWTKGLGHNPNPLKFATPQVFVAYHCRLAQADHIAIDAAGTPAPLAYYARFEDLEAEWTRICERLGQDLPLEHRNRSQREDYTTYYDDATRALVAERNAPFIARFGYAFGA